MTLQWRCTSSLNAAGWAVGPRDVWAAVAQLIAADGCTFMILAYPCACGAPELARPLLAKAAFSVFLWRPNPPR